MTPATVSKNSIAPRSFRFESYGVRMEIASGDQEMIDRAEAIARRALLGNVRAVNGGTIDHTIELTRTKAGTFRLVRDGVRIASGRSERKFFKFFDSILRVTVGEYAVDKVFMHAGVVGWKGRAILMPADSFKGKSTLTAELVRCGAEYYSDDFAIFDGEGMLHPFARPLAMRRDSEVYKEYILTPESLGGRYGTTPIPVETILFCEYSPSADWSPTILTAGEGVMQMLPHALSLRHRPDFALAVLNKVASHAIIASSLRGDAKKFAKTLLNFIDKRVI